MAMNSCNIDAKVSAHAPKSRKIMPLVKPLEIPQLPPTAFDIFYKEEKQRWIGEYKKTLLDSNMNMSQPQLEKRLVDRMRHDITLRWRSLTEEKRACYEERAKEQAKCFQEETVRYKSVTGQSNPLYRHDATKDGMRLISIDWSKQKAHYNWITQSKSGIDKIMQSKALLQPRVTTKYTPMFPPPMRLASTKTPRPMRPSPQTLKNPNFKTRSNEPSFKISNGNPFAIGR